MEGGRPSTSTRMEEGFKFGFSRWLFLSFFWMGVGRVIVNQSNGEIKWPRVIAAGGLPGFVPGFFFRRRQSIPVPSSFIVSMSTGDRIGFGRVLLGWKRVFTRYFLDFSGFIGLDRVLPGFTEFYWV